MIKLGMFEGGAFEIRRTTPDAAKNSAIEATVPERSADDFTIRNRRTRQIDSRHLPVVQPHLRELYITEVEANRNPKAGRNLAKTTGKFLDVSSTSKIMVASSLTLRTLYPSFLNQPDCISFSAAASMISGVNEEMRRHGAVRYGTTRNDGEDRHDGPRTALGYAVYGRRGRGLVRRNDPDD